MGVAADGPVRTCLVLGDLLAVGVGGEVSDHGFVGSDAHLVAYSQVSHNVRAFIFILTMEMSDFQSAYLGDLPDTREGVVEVLTRAVEHLTRVQQEFDELIQTTGEYETELEESKADLEQRLSEASQL